MTTLRTGPGKRQNRAGFTPLEILKTPNRKAKSLMGFTLIELVIVASIIMILAAFSTPLFKSTFSRFEIKDVSCNIGKMIKYAQYRAIMEEKTYMITFDFKKRAYRMLAESRENGESKFKETAGRFADFFYLPEGMNFRGETNKMTFLPNGRCDKLSIYIADKRNKVIEIKTTGRAGYVEILSAENEE